MAPPRKYVSSAERQAAYRARTRQEQQRQLQQKGLPVLPTIATFPGWPRWRSALQSARALVAQAP